MVPDESKKSAAGIARYFYLKEPLPQPLQTLQETLYECLAEQATRDLAAASGLSLMSEQPHPTCARFLVER